MPFSSGWVLHLASKPGDTFHALLPRAFAVSNAGHERHRYFLGLVSLVHAPKMHCGLQIGSAFFPLVATVCLTQLTPEWLAAFAWKPIFCGIAMGYTFVGVELLVLAASGFDRNAHLRPLSGAPFQLAVACC